MRVLVLDDNEERHKKFRQWLIGTIAVHVYSYEETRDTILGSPQFDLAFLDHDLSIAAALGTPEPGEKTGTDVAQFISELPEHQRPKRVVIHSYNVPGRLRMAAILHGAGIPVTIKPFGSK